MKFQHDDFLIKPNLDLDTQKEKKEVVSIRPDWALNLFAPKEDWKRLEAKIALLMPEEWRKKATAIIDWDTIDRRYARFFWWNVSNSGIPFVLYSIEDKVYTDFIQAVVKKDDSVYIFINAIELTKMPRKMIIMGIEHEGKNLTSLDIISQELFYEEDWQKTEEELKEDVALRMEIISALHQIESGQAKNINVEKQQ